MSIKVVTWGTRNVGSYAVRAVIQYPELKLVSHIVSTPENAGVDVADLETALPLQTQDCRIQ
jgi:hypothetical protein